MHAVLGFLRLLAGFYGLVVVFVLIAAHNYRWPQPDEDDDYKDIPLYYHRNEMEADIEDGF